MPFAFVLCQPPPPARIAEEAARVLAQHGRLAPVNIAQRVAYAETGATGQGVTETKDQKAGAEICHRVGLREGDTLCLRNLLTSMDC